LLHEIPDSSWCHFESFRVIASLLAHFVVTTMANDYGDNAPWYEWIGLIVVSSISFWAQAVVTEERFVPSLNVFCTKFSIADDIAGATMMAAAASSPELLASFTTLFITHTSLGIGTIVGSEIFNQVSTLL
jgi:hypothetical protein